MLQSTDNNRWCRSVDAALAVTAAQSDGQRDRVRGHSDAESVKGLRQLLGGDDYHTTIWPLGEFGVPKQRRQVLRRKHSKRRQSQRHAAIKQQHTVAHLELDGAHTEPRQRDTCEQHHQCIAVPAEYEMYAFQGHRFVLSLVSAAEHVDGAGVNWPVRRLSCDELQHGLGEMVRVHADAVEQQHRGLLGDIAVADLSQSLLELLATLAAHPQQSKRV
jgi:hypothetical protein